MAEHETSRCARPELAALLACYEHDLLEAEERRRFEDHLLECDACFAELERGARVTAAMREHAPDLLRALHRREATSVSAGHALRRLARAVLEGLRRPAILAPVLAALVIAVVLLRPGSAPPDLAGLATFPTDIVAGSEVRAPGTAETDALRELLATGRGHIAAGNFAAAERFLQAARDRTPESTEAAWLLGLALALQGAPERAIAPLEFAAASPDSTARVMGQWILANCYLKLGEVDQARSRLEQVRAAGGPFAGSAAGVLARMPGPAHGQKREATRQGR